jgi:hypothetical protein
VWLRSASDRLRRRIPTPPPLDERGNCDRYRYGELIFIAFAVSTINAVVSRR